ncbi:MAG: hypothetical protein RSE25_04750 [Bacteroidales bacterium]
MKPRNLKQALEQGFTMYKIEAKGNKQIRVDLKSKFPKNGEINFVQYWIDRDYFRRTYPTAYERF